MAITDKALRLLLGSGSRRGLTRQARRAGAVKSERILPEHLTERTKVVEPPLPNVSRMLADRPGSPGGFTSDVPITGLRLKEHTEGIKRVTTPEETGPAMSFNEKMVDRLMEIEKTLESDPVIIGVNELSDDQLATIAARIAETAAAVPPGQAFASPGMTNVLFMSPTAFGSVQPLGFSKGAVTMLNDALGPYRSPALQSLVVSTDLSPAQLRHTISHELGHALIGIRAPAYSARVLKAVIGTKRWEALVPELVELSREYRPYLWNALTPKTKAYVLQESELLADALGSTMIQPIVANQIAPNFKYAIADLLNQDPRTKSVVKIAGLFPFIAAGASLLQAGITLGSDERTDT